MPGRVTETWVRIRREGTYYGQCSELCGMDHGYMPIVVEVVEQEAFQAWLTSEKDAAAELASAN